jgi:DNA (cytosine-5)-methyltransferase 1
VEIKAIDLFCGAGGSSWGAFKARVDVVAAFDRWDLAAKTHKINFPETKFFGGKLENRNLTKLKRKLGRIDLILSSPECTSHSPARGNRTPCQESKDTAFQVIRFANAFKPRWIVIENVVSMRRWSRYWEFKSQLEELGYHITEQVLNAADFGVPQSRRRLFILCDRKRKPGPTARPAGKRRLPARLFINLNGSYRWSPLVTQKRAKATLERANKAIAALGKKKSFLLVYYGSDHAGGWQRMSSPLRTITTLDRFAVVKSRKGVHLMRMLQVPELQAAMGMDKMQFPYGSRRDRIKMLGNAVCPPVMKEVVRSLVGG